MKYFITYEGMFMYKSGPQGRIYDKSTRKRGEIITTLPDDAITDIDTFRARLIASELSRSQYRGFNNIESLTILSIIPLITSDPEVTNSFTAPSKAQGTNEDEFPSLDYPLTNNMPLEKIIENG